MTRLDENREALPGDGDQAVRDAGARPAGPDLPAAEDPGSGGSEAGADAGRRGARRMSSQDDDRETLLREVYRDLTVCLGGIFAVHAQEISDEVIWEIARGVGGLFRRHRNRIVRADPAKAGGEHRPHPAIVHLLRELQEATP